MLHSYEEIKETLRSEPRTWLITGVAGFIGSNLLEQLLLLGQNVIGLDNFATGKPSNLAEVMRNVGARVERYRFLHGDIRDLPTCRAACAGVDIVLHQAALGSIPRSIHDPVATNQVNVDGFLHMLVAARDAKVKRFVYAASSSTYGDHPGLPKVEHLIGRPLSPYAVSKYVNELYALVFQRTYGLQSIGLRYFNVFGRRQDPDGAYAAVIPKWVCSMLRGEPCCINGDGETSRDFCYVENIVQANLRASVVNDEGALGEVYNVGCGAHTTLNELFALIRDGLGRYRPEIANIEPMYSSFRPGDMRHSLADISKIHSGLGYVPTHTVAEGIEEALEWYVGSFAEEGVRAA